VGFAADHFRLRFDRLQEELRTYLERRLPRGPGGISADDLLQEVWLTASQTLSTVRNPDSTDQWLRRITQRKLIDALRFGRCRKRTDGRPVLRGVNDANTSYVGLYQYAAAEQRTPSSADAAREAVDAVKQALACLPDDYRRALMLHHIDGLSREDVARAMSRTPSAVNGLLYRGLLSLRRALGSPEKFFTVR